MKDVRFVELDQSDDLGKVLHAKQAKEIISYIESQQKATASQIAKGLKIPLSTVQYQLKALVKAGIVTDEEFSYSQKGREVVHYSLSGEIIVLVPSKAQKLRIAQQLNMILPAVAGVVSIGLLGSLWKLLTTQGPQETADAFAQTAPLAYDAVVSENSAMMMKAAEPVAQEMTRTATTDPHLFLYLFLGIALGALAVVGLFIITQKLKKRKS